MIMKEGQVSRKTAKEDRIAICPHFGCTHLEKVKPLKFGFFGFRKYPKCSKHKSPLVFVDEFVANFLHAVNTCLFDISSLPPENLTSLIKTRAPNGLKDFVNGWMYCNPIGRGAQIVSNCMDGLSRGYMKLLSKKQRKTLLDERSSKKRNCMLRSGLKKIADEYTAFLQDLREKSEVHYIPRKLRPLSEEVRNILKMWLKSHLKEIQAANGKKRRESLMQDEFLPMLKEEYDKILHAGTCTSLLGKSPAIVTKGVSPFELFSAYHEFLKAELCRELKKKDVKSLLEESEDAEIAIVDDFDNAPQNALCLEKLQTGISEKKVDDKKIDVNSSTTKYKKTFNDYKLKDYAQYLKTEIDNKLNNILDLEGKYGPTVVQLIQQKYKDYVKSFYNKGIFYSKILSKIGLKQKRIIRNKLISNLANELRYITTYLKEVLELRSRDAPNPNQLTMIGYRGFVVFLQKNNIDFSQVAKAAGLEYRSWRTDLLNYYDMLELARIKSVVFPYTHKEFEEKMKNRITSPSHVTFKWQCPRHGEWGTSYQTLKDSKFGCPVCYRESTEITYDDCIRLGKSKGVEFAMNPTEFKEVIENERREAERKGINPKRPNHIKLKWRCREHGEWETSYQTLKISKIGCPICGLEYWQGQVSVDYEDFIELGDSRIDLEFPLAREQFDKIIANSITPPSTIQFPWTCSIDSSHRTWHAPYSRIKLGHGCPLCGEKIKTIGTLLHPILEFNSVKYLRLKDCEVDYETSIAKGIGFRPDLLIKRDNAFKFNVENHQSVVQFPYKIERISVDFTLGLTPISVLGKCFKNYQDKARYLITVLLREGSIRTASSYERIISNSQNIRSYEHGDKHIKVINFSGFIEFLGQFTNTDEWKCISNMTQAVNLALRAIRSTRAFNNLINLSRSYSRLLKNL